MQAIVDLQFQEVRRGLSAEQASVTRTFSPLAYVRVQTLDVSRTLQGGDEERRMKNLRLVGSYRGLDF